MVGVAIQPHVVNCVGGALLFTRLEELRRRGQALPILMPSKADFTNNMAGICTLINRFSDRTIRNYVLWRINLLWIAKWCRSMDIAWSCLPKAYTEGFMWQLYGTGKEGMETSIRQFLCWRNVNIAVVKTMKGQIEGYAVYRLGAPEIPVTEFTTRRAQRGLLNYFITIVLKVKAFAGMKRFYDTGYRFVRWKKSL